MIVIGVHWTGTEYLVVRTTKGRSAPEWISCGSRYELVSVLLVLGVADAEVADVLRVLTWSSDVEVRM
jgi:hypothetical protein